MTIDVRPCRSSSRISRRSSAASAVARLLLLTFDKTARIFLSFIYRSRSAAHDETKRSPSRHPRPAGAQNPRARPGARLGHLAADPADVAGAAPGQPGLALSGVAPIGRRGMDR